PPRFRTPTVVAHGYGGEGNRSCSGRVQSNMDSTPLSVRSAPLADLSAGLDRTGTTLAGAPVAVGLGDATALALGLVARDLVTVLLRAAVDHRRSAADAATAVQEIAAAGAASADAYAGIDADAARALRHAGSAA
ncbi:type VII secretion target, partial [Williamsia sp. SKLECPSW1]